MSRSDDAMNNAALAPQPRARSGMVIAAVLVVVILLGIGLWLAFRPGADMVQGMADADNVNVSSKVSARVAKLQVREGDKVKAGQVLFELDSPEVAAKQRQAAGALESAKAVSKKADDGARPEDIRAAEANWKRARAGNELAQSTFRRLDNLYREGVIARQKRDEAQAQARNSQQLEVAARAQYDMALAGARPEDKTAAAGQVQQAEGAMAEVEAAREETLGRAPVAGEVGKRLADIGELVPAGYPVFTVVDVGRMWVALNLREDQFGGAKVGKRLRGDVPALDKQDVEFEIYYIAPAGEYATWRATRQSAGYDVKAFEVRARPVQPLHGFRPGMSVLFGWPQG